MTKDSFHVGFRADDKSDVLLPTKVFRKHFIALGASGSGKTVFVKVVIEEFIRKGIPVILVDLQGDLASLALMGDKDTIVSKGVPGEYYEEYKKRMQPAIFTPANVKGIPISMNPLKKPPENIDLPELIQTIDYAAETVANLAGYNTEKGKGATVKTYIYFILEAVWKNKKFGGRIGTINGLIDAIESDEKILSGSQQSTLEDKDKTNLLRALQNLTVGTDQLLFNYGVPLDIENLVKFTDKGKTPLSVLYLNTLRDEETKVNLMADFASKVYSYMLKNPSPKKIQLAVVFDELAGIMPPSQNPPTKKPLLLLMKQARKYGVSMLLATQNFSDVDYKSLAQVGTWAIGKISTQQDIEKIRKTVQSISPNQVNAVISRLQKLDPGEFMLISTDVFDEVQHMHVRWLLTDHKALTDDEVKIIMEETGVRKKFESLIPFEMEEDEPLLAEDPVKEEGSADELSEAEDMFEVASVGNLDEISNLLEKDPVAISSSEVAEIVGMTEDDAEKEMKVLAKKKKLQVVQVGKESVFWSSKYEMDPGNNIVGSMFELPVKIIQGKAMEIARKEIPKSLGRYFQEIINTDLKFIPLWRIGSKRQVEEKQGGFFNKKTVVVTKKETNFLNALNGKMLVIDAEKKKHVLEFRNDVTDLSEVSTLPKDMPLEPILLNELTPHHVRPKINREEAGNKIKRFIGGRIDRKVIPTLIWYPVYEFHKRDKETKQEYYSWVDGIYGSYFETKKEIMG